MPYTQSNTRTKNSKSTNYTTSDVKTSRGKNGKVTAKGTPKMKYGGMLGKTQDAIAKRQRYLDNM